MRKEAALISTVLFLMTIYLPLNAAAEEATSNGIHSNNTITNMDELRTQMKQFVLESTPVPSNVEMQIEISDLDPRFKLSPCDTNLTLAMTQELTPESLAGRHTVSIHCQTPQAWSVYLPITVNIWKDIPVLVTSLKRGDTIRSQDIVMQRQNVAKLQNRYLDNKESVVGKFITRSVAAGTAVYPELLAEPDLVRKGDQVALVFQTGSVIVRTNGTAKQSGKQGDHISVENLTATRTMTGQIIDKNTVSLSL